MVAAAGVSAPSVAARRMRRPVPLAAAAGTAFGMASVFTKAPAEGVPVRGFARVRRPDAAAVAVLAGGGMLLSQAAYRGAGLTAPPAALTVVNPVVAAAVGLTLFREASGTGRRARRGVGRRRGRGGRPGRAHGRRTRPRQMPTPWARRYFSGSMSEP